MRPRLREHLLKDLPKYFVAEAIPKVGAVGVIGNLIFPAPPQKPTEGHVCGGTFHDLAIGQVIMKA
jgi:hypothetical protein